MKPTEKQLNRPKVVRKPSGLLLARSFAAESRFLLRPMLLDVDQVRHEFVVGVP